MNYQKELLQKYETDVFVVGGGAAGSAAALASDCEDVRRVEIDALKQALLKLGAYLPNA